MKRKPGLPKRPSRAGQGSRQLLYLYGVVQSSVAPRMPKAARPLPRMSPPRALDAGKGVWLVASDADPDAYAAPAIEAGLRDLAWVSACAAAHEGVVEAVSRGGTVVPTKLFTLFVSEERALAHIAKARAEIERTFVRIAGCEEWGVRVLFDSVRAAKMAAERVQKETRGMSAGAGFLLRKKRTSEAEHEALGRAREEADELFDVLGALARDARRRPPVQDAVRARVLLDAVLLVPQGKANRLDRTIQKASARLVSAGFDVVVSGPWPAYHFVASS